MAPELAGRDEIAALGRLASRCLADASVERLSPDGRFFDVCRMLRNELSYNAADVVTETELGELLHVVKQFAGVVAAWLVARHPSRGIPGSRRFTPPA